MIPKYLPIKLWINRYFIFIERGKFPLPSLAILTQSERDSEIFGVGKLPFSLL